MGPWATRRLLGLVLKSALLLVIVMAFLPSSTPCNWPRARRFQCVNNLKQIGLGIESYTNACGSFPPGTIPNPDLALERRLGWGVTILSYIDNAEYLPDHGLTQDDVLSQAWDSPVLGDLAMAPPGFFRCPGSMTRSNPVAIAGLGIDSPGLPTRHPRSGIFGDRRQTTPADIKDGASNTMMVVETDSAPAPWFAGGRATVRGLDPGRQPYIGPGRQFGGNHRTSRNPLFAREGANVLLADGSIRFVKDSIDPKVFEALSTMAGGESVAAGIDD